MKSGRLNPNDALLSKSKISECEKVEKVSYRSSHREQVVSSEEVFLNQTMTSSSDVIS